MTARPPHGPTATTPRRVRLRRVCGQVLGTERMPAEGRSYEDVLIQLARSVGAVDNRLAAGRRGRSVRRD